MAETVIAPQEVAGPYISESDTQLTTVTFTAADATNGNKITMPGRRMLFLFNNVGVGAATVTIEGSDDPYGRDTTITAFSIAAGAFAARIFEPVGWEQTLGGRDISLTVSAADIEILAIPL